MTKTRRVQVGGTVFLVRTPWWLMRRFTARLAEIEAADLGEKAREAAVEAATHEMLGEAVVGWEGVRDEEGRPAAWAAERLDDLDALDVAELVGKLAAPAEELVPGKGLSG